MKSMKKAVVLLLCVGAIAAASVFGTMAYLTSTTDTAENTFTVGKVAITLDEADVDEYGDSITNADRVLKNDYTLLPGEDYTKDPTVHFKAGSEASYIFVKVKNDIAEYESDDNDYISIEKQITQINNWTELTGISATGNTKIYWKKVDANKETDATDIDYPVFGAFAIKESWDGTGLSESATVTVTAYAIQAAGFDSADDAWTAGAWN